MSAVDEWNAQHPIGSLVLAWPGTRDAEPLVTITRSAAWSLGHGAPVVAVEGKAGGIALTHVDPRAPMRIQRRRTPGWANLSRATYVGRPSRWGNPWSEGDTAWTVGPGGRINREPREPLTREQAVESFRNSQSWDPDWVAVIRREMGGRDLMCWCPLVDDEGQPVPCHADVLLDLANAEASATPEVAT